MLHDTFHWDRGYDMKLRTGILLAVATMIVVVGCGGTGGEKSAALTFDMAVQQAEGDYLIYGFVFNDLDQDEVMDEGEPGISNVTVTLLSMDKVIAVVKTIGDGTYFFDVIASGIYTVVETDLVGYVSTTENEVSAEIVDADVQVDFGDYIDPGLPVDVKPGSDVNPLNLKSNGVLPVAICGSETFDVAQIDPDSLRLNGVAPLRWGYEDVCGQDDTSTDPGMNGDDEEMPDGYEDMTLKFNTQDIAGTLGEVWRGKIETLTMVGFFLDGSSILGEETVRIVQIPK